jgi:hypothetical protein
MSIATDTDDIANDFIQFHTSMGDIDSETDKTQTLVDQDMNVVLDYLMELHRLDNTSKSEIQEFDILAIDNAGRMNDQMQQEVKKQIIDIDKKMEENTRLLVIERDY